MKRFIINTTENHAEILNRSVKKAIESGTITYRTHNDYIDINTNDDFITLTNENKTNKPELRNKYIELYNKSTVIDIDRNKLDKLNQKEINLNKKRIDQGLDPYIFYEYRIEYKYGIPFKKNNKLEDYSYSLMKIYKRYLEPINHFNRTFTNINLFDYDNLYNENIYLTRSTFGYLINSLPYENRILFILNSIENFKTTDLNSIEIKKGLSFLIDFIKYGIINKGNYLIEINRLSEENKNIFDDNSELFFGEINEEEGEGELINDSIQDQATLFSELNSIEPEINKFKSFKLKRKENEIESIYKKLPKLQNWPIDLSKIENE